MKDLLEQLIKLNEAPVQPGERKGISFKLKKLEKISDKLRQYQNSMSHMKMAQLPGDLQKEMQQLQDKLNAEIDKVNQAYQIEYEKSKVNDRPVKMDNLFKALAKNCKEIIKVYKELNRNDFERGKFLYRGIKSSDDALYGKPFESRKPKDSNRDLHELVNGTINSLGLAANRENAMFVTGDRSQASGYGNSLYIMFPIDGFKFTWSKTVKDLVLDSGKRMDMMDKEAVRQLRELIKKTKAESKDPSSFPISDPDDIFYTGYNYDYDYKRVSNAIDQGLLPDEAQTLLDDILTNKSIQEHFEFTDQELFNAILSEKEIYIRGDYYAVKTEHSRELFKFLESINTDDVELPENFGEVPNILDRGDVVRILAGTHQGKLGTITYVYGDKYEVFITQKTGDINIPKDDVELYHLPDGSIPVYERDDKIIVSDDQSRLYGTVGTIYSAYSNGKVEIVDLNGKNSTVYKNQIETYTPEREEEIKKDLESRPPVISEKDDVVVSDPDNEYYGARGRVNFIYSSGTIEVYFPNKSMYIDFQPNQLVLLKNAPPELLKKTPGEYNLGDTVRIIDGEYKGYSGKVSYLYTNGTKAEIDLGGNQVDVPISSIEHSDQANSDSLNGIKVGDNVKIINHESSYYGQTGEVIETGKTPDGKPWIKFKSPTLVGGVKTFVNWVEKVDDQPKFKEGDKVQINYSQSLYSGKEGTVSAGPDEDGDYKVAVGNKITYVPAAGLKIITPTTAATFAMGDKVKILDKSSGFYGEIGKIENGPDNDGDYTVIFNNDDNEWSYFPSDAMEKVEEPKAATKFAVDDIVKITGPSAYNNSSYIGYGGTITSVSDDGKFAGVQLDPDTILTYDTSNLVKGETDEISNLTWEPEPEVKAPIKIGDTVKNIKDGHPHYGQTGEVKTVYHSGNVGLVYSDGTQAVDPGNWLEKVNAPAQTEAPKFEVNDRVEVVSQFPGLIGMKGKITQVSPNYDFVSVWIDGNTAASSFPTSALKKIDANDPTEFHLGDMVQVTNSDLTTYGQKGKVTDSDVNMLVIKDSDSGEVFFAKKSSVKKIG